MTFGCKNIFLEDRKASNCFNIIDCEIVIKMLSTE